MSKTKVVNKHRKAYCSQNYDFIKLKCPICLLDTIPRNCRIYKNLAGLWWHIKQNHDGFVCSEYDVNDILDVLNSLDRAIKWGIVAL